MALPNEENHILKPLIDNANDANVKPFVKNDGKSTLFQRDVDFPEIEPLEDEIDDNTTLPIDNEEQYNEPDIQNEATIADENSDNTPNDTNEVENSKLPKKNPIKKSRYISEENKASDKESDEIQHQIAEPKIYSSQKQNIRLRNISPKTKYNNNKSSVSSTPETILNSSSKRPNGSSLKKNNNISTGRFYKHGSNYKSSLVSILIYCIAVLAILIGIVTYVKEDKDDSLINNSFELEAVTRLNDCVTPINSISIGNYSSSFIDSIKNGSSIYLKYDDETQSIVIKKQYQSLLCKAINFGDHHPDLCGLFIIWIIIFFYYINYKISRIRAERIAPDVMRLLQSKHMCYIDEAKKKMKDNGYCLFGAWWQVKSIISNNNKVKTVKMVDTKPFWSLNSHITDS